MKIKDVNICEINSTNKKIIEKSIEFYDIRKNKKIPIYSKLSSGGFGYLKDVIFTASNFRIVDGNFVSDLEIVDEKMLSLGELESETIDTLLRNIDSDIQFSLSFDQFDIINQMLLVNVYTSDDKKREDMVEKAIPESPTMVEGDKMLYLNLQFRIPKSFKGDFNDAILELYKYRTGQKPLSKDFKPDPDKDLHSNWWEMVHETDRRLLGEVSLSELKDGELVDCFK